jgi:DNA-binding LacI/PurR family transcriptional regulator
MTAKPIKLADVAKAAGVSHGTASNVFSRPEIVRDELRERVLAAAAKLNYAGPDPRGRMLRAGKVNAIGVATAEPLAYFFEDPFARVVMSGISQVCDELGAGISLVSAASNEQLAWNIQSALVDGFIVFCIEGGSRLVQLTRERGLPFVALDFGDDDETVASIVIDDYAGARLAARHLAELWHRRFGILSLQAQDLPIGPSSYEHTANGIYSGTRDRIRGYFEELSGRGIETASIPIYETENDRKTTEAALAYLFERQNPPTAILSMSDRMAIEAIHWLKRRGMSVPGEVSIVGFDDVPEAATCQPALTTIAQPGMEIGRRAAKAILEFDGTLRREMLPVELIVRGSTAPA